MSITFITVLIIIFAIKILCMSDFEVINPFIADKNLSDKYFSTEQNRRNTCANRVSFVEIYR